MSVIYGIVVILFCLFLIGLALGSALCPTKAERFLRAFASSAATHYGEQALRLLVGVSFLNFARAMRHADLFWVFGWIIIISTAGLLLIPWQWHQQFATRVMPPLFRHMRLFALGAFALGGFILYCVSPTFV